MRKLAVSKLLFIAVLFLPLASTAQSWEGTLASTPVTVQAFAGGSGLVFTVYMQAYPLADLSCESSGGSADGHSPGVFVCGIDPDAIAFGDLVANRSGADWNLYNLVFPLNGSLYVCAATSRGSLLRCRFVTPSGTLSNYADSLTPGQDD